METQPRDESANFKESYLQWRQGFLGRTLIIKHAVHSLDTHAGVPRCETDKIPPIPEDIHLDVTNVTVHPVRRLSRSASESVVTGNAGTTSSR